MDRRRQFERGKALLLNDPAICPENRSIMSTFFAYQEDVDDAWREKTGGPSEMEEDMLDFAFDVRPTSRLSCQIKVTDALDGLIVRVPEKQF